ncbi:cobalamin B12-binding domain-containing protein [Parafrankia sp. EUN1f]|uniref:cobalamin B12-binding domain-containing protein n=1 Tax=Parafrankia sp. EUN1f TaxID=102897 RepID=UPI0001C474DE|nr:cobalamin-dependent protein [Parafrankia sp. EUN1f]EFC79753.1 cobalamin B12-binding domain protein [Parafrankia sp. EUN1f]
MSRAPIRCVLGMVGSDKHNKGIRLIARIFRDHGLEVVYIGEHNTSQRIASVAVSEDADFVGVSFSNGNYVPRVKELLGALAEAGGADIGLVVGGLIHPEDLPELEAAGVTAVFGPEATTQKILATIDEKFGRVDTPSEAAASDLRAAAAGRMR